MAAAASPRVPRGHLLPSQSWRNDSLQCEGRNHERRYTYASQFLPHTRALHSSNMFSRTHSITKFPVAYMHYIPY